MGIASVSETYQADGATAEVVDYVPWNDRQNIAQSMIGGWQSLGGFQVYVFPAVYGDNTSLVCKSITYKNHGDIDDTGDWLNAEGTFSYGKPDTQNNVVDYGELAFDVGSEAIGLPGGMFTWTSGPDNGKRLNSEDITPQAFAPTMTIKLKRKSPQLYLSPIVSTIGRINGGALGVAGYGFADSTVLFAGAQISRKFTSEGNELWDYDLQFIAKSFSWNQFFHKSGNLCSIDPIIYGYGALDFFFT